MNRLLLDTHVLLWWDMNDPRLSGRARAVIEQAGNVYVSAASAWEITIKRALGKLESTRDPHIAVVEGGFDELPVTFEHAEAVSTLPLHHADPFDRLIIAVAKVEGLTIITHDGKFSRYDVPIIAAGKPHL